MENKQKPVSVYQFRYQNTAKRKGQYANNFKYVKKALLKLDKFKLSYALVLALRRLNATIVRSFKKEG